MATTKQCTGCKQVLPASEFWRRGKNGLLSRCKTCQTEMVREWRRANPDRVREHKKGLKGSDHYRKQQRDRARERTQERKARAVDAYGGKCACCGEDRLVFLAIDHENGGGNQHRKESGMGGGARAYRWLEEQGWPPGFRVLCHNCNFATAYGRTCPHQEK